MSDETKRNRKLPFGCKKRAVRFVETRGSRKKRQTLCCHGSSHTSDSGWIQGRREEEALKILLRPANVRQVNWVCPESEKLTVRYFGVVPEREGDTFLFPRF